MSKLYIIATPIGNLEDIGFRALRILKEVDLILCEDTRVTKKLLEHYHLEKPVESYHQHSNFNKIEKIKELFKQGKNLALVSDSGTPGISDPGNKLIEEVKDIAEIIPIPVALIPALVKRKATKMMPDASNIQVKGEMRRALMRKACFACKRAYRG